MPVRCGCQSSAGGSGNEKSSSTPILIRQIFAFLDLELFDRSREVAHDTGQRRLVEIFYLLLTEDVGCSPTDLGFFGMTVSEVAGANLAGTTIPGARRF